MMLRIRDRVVRLDWRTSDTTGTAYKVVAASPDGDYSIDALHSWAGPRVFDDRVHTEITACSWAGVNALGWGLSGDPFWSPDPDLKHHLWINKCGGVLGKSEGKLFWCELALIDVKRMVQIDSIPGRLVGRTADGRSVVLLRGDSLEVVSLESRTKSAGAQKRLAEDASKEKVRLRAVVTSWSSNKGLLVAVATSAADTVGVYVVEVQSSDWLPDWTGSSPRCGRGMRVRRVIGQSQVEIEYDPGALRTDSQTLPAGLALVAAGSTMTLRTNSYDAGRSIRLSVVSGDEH
jgi:hypothetical protein